MNLNVHPAASRPDAGALEALGAEHFAARRFAAAAEAWREAAGLVELAQPELALKLARAELAAGRPEAAAAGLVGLVDAGAGFKAWAAAAGLLARCPAETWPGVRRRLRAGLVGTWTTDTLAPLVRLAAARHGIALEIAQPPFGQYFNATLDPASELLKQSPDLLILAPDARALGFPAFSDTPGEDVAAAVDRFAGVWDAVRRAAAPTILQLGVATPGGDPLGHHGAGQAGARRSMVQAFNAALAARAASGDVGFVDVAALAAREGAAAFFDPRGWYLAKLAYGPAALPAIARHLAAVLAARLGLSRRALVLDLDNTLWGGVVGDDGVGGIVLGQGAEGEAFVDFQVALKELAARGILLAVASKNDPEVARRPFLEHPEMVLRLDDIAAFVAGWGPKSQSIVEIAETLSLGLSSLAFLDDNPYERAEVRRALPEVDVPVMPEEPTGFRAALEAYPYLEPAGFTEADRARAEQYRARAKAEAIRVQAGSLEEYQASLGMVARIGPVDAVNIARVVQLINKTNQFNLTTRRRNQAELEAFLAEDGAEAFWVRLADKFADHGLIAVALAKAEGNTLGIDTLLMSCRVLGRGVEALVLAELGERAAARGCARVEGVYLPSDRNGMVADLYPRLGLAEVSREADGTARFAAAVDELGAALGGGAANIAIERV
jgi:FkbH-like protein